MHGLVRTPMGPYARETWQYAPALVCTCQCVPVWASTPRKPGFTPHYEYDRSRSSQLGPVSVRTRSFPFAPVRPGNLALRPYTSVYVHVGASLGVYAPKSWLHASIRVCTCPFVPVWVCTPRKRGFTPPDEYARACWRPVFLGNLPLRSRTSVRVLVFARLGLYARETLLFAPVRVCPFLFGPFWVRTPRKHGFTPSKHVPVRASSGLYAFENLAVDPLALVHEPVGARLGMYARKTWLNAPGRMCTCPFAHV